MGDAHEARDEHGYKYTAFLAACLRGDAESIAALAKAGCDTTAKDNIGRTGLMHVAVTGSAEAMQVVVH